MKTKLATLLLILSVGTSYADQFFGGGGSSATPVPVATATPAPTATPIPPVATATPAPTSTPQPTATPQTIPTVKIPYAAYSTTNFPNSGSTFLAVTGGAALDSAGNNFVGAAVAGTAKNLACWTSASAQTGSKTETIAVEADNADSALTCTIDAASTCTTLLGSTFSATAKCCEDTTHSFSVTQGMGLAMKLTAANTPNVGVVMCKFELDPS